MDQLCQVLDRIDIVMRRRRNELYARRRVAHLGNPRVDLLTGQLASLTWLGALRHLDLQFLSLRQIVTRHAEATRCNLLDRTIFRISVGLWRIAGRIFPPFSRVAATANAIHGNGQRLVRFLANRTIRHGPAFKAARDRLNWLDLVDGDGLAVGF